MPYARYPSHLGGIYGDPLEVLHYSSFAGCAPTRETDGGRCDADLGRTNPAQDTIPTVSGGLNLCVGRYSQAVIERITSSRVSAPDSLVSAVCASQCGTC
jgi:hypothetical protein